MRKLFNLIRNDQKTGFVKIILEEDKRINIDVHYSDTYGRAKPFENYLINRLTLNHKDYLIISAPVVLVKGNKVQIDDLILELPYPSSRVISSDPEQREYVLLIEFENGELVLKDIVTMKVWQLLTECKDIIAENQRKNRLLREEVKALFQELWPVILGVLSLMIITVWYLVKMSYS